MASKTVDVQVQSGRAFSRKSITLSRKGVVVSIPISKAKLCQIIKAFPHIAQEG